MTKFHPCEFDRFLASINIDHGVLALWPTACSDPRDAGRDDGLTSDNCQIKYSLSTGPPLNLVLESLPSIDLECPWAFHDVLRTMDYPDG